MFEILSIDDRNLIIMHDVSGPKHKEAVLAEAEKENLMPLKTESEKEKRHAAVLDIGSSETACNISEAHNAFQRNFPKYAVSVCACLLVFLFWVSGISGTKQEDVFLVLDINPSVQIVMNDSYQVKTLRGLNQDGKDVLNRITWDKKESVFEVLDVLLQDIAEKSYLQENQGILVTICLPDQNLCQELENRLGESIDRKLQEIGLSGVMTAFVQGEKGAEEQGRKQLEAKLTETYGLDEKQASQHNFPQEEEALQQREEVPQQKPQQNEFESDSEDSVQPQGNTESPVQREIPAEADSMENLMENQEAPVQDHQEDGGSGAVRKKDQKDNSQEDKVNKDNSNKDNSNKDNSNKDKDKKDNGNKDKDKKDNGNRDKDKKDGGNKDKKDNSNKNKSKNKDKNKKEGDNKENNRKNEGSNGKSERSSNRERDAGDGGSIEKNHNRKIKLRPDKK